jgi:endonuclease/exonuclease/phosphatase family metal-dependent hydrolase
MKIATYNVWYPNIDIRAEQLIEAINNIDADIVGLQEVPPVFYKKLIANVKYPHHAYILYDDKDGMGLAFLSKHSLYNQSSLLESIEFNNSIALNSILEVDGIKFSVTNVHLPWDSALAKEQQIVAIDKYIHSQKSNAHFFILLGDFNCTLNSSVHHYLLGDQTLLGCEANPYWNDLATAHAVLNGYDIVPTLDFVNNPRWRGKNTVYIPDVCDRIYIMESFNWDYEFNLHDVNVFGKEVSPKTGYAPSDHYGLLAEVTFKV